MAATPNYAAQMQSVLASLAQKPRLLLHACCAPCCSAVLERLAPHFCITILYYNPNIYPQAEFVRRGQELQRFVQAVGIADLRLVALPYTPQDFAAVAHGLEAAPERGARCTRCYELRLRRAAEYAKQHGFGWFCSTLSISPHKDAARINALGEQIAAAHGLRHLPNDFKKQEGYKRSLQLSRQYDLYRQDYCGCVFSAQAAGRRET